MLRISIASDLETWTPPVRWCESRLTCNIEYCQAPVTGPQAPEGAPVAGGGGREDEGKGAPPGEYYFNAMPGNISRALLCGETISVLTEDRLIMLDLSVDQQLPVNTDLSSVQLTFDRIDGPSSGSVQFDHLLAVLATS